MKINGQKIHPDGKFLYVTLTQAALKARSCGLDKAKFVRFAEEVWDSMLLTDEDVLMDVLEGQMEADITAFTKGFKRDH